jgi:cyclomaltodextrin glucanotransferase
LVLPPQSVLIFSYIGEKVKGKTIVRLQINGIATQFGESILVIGDCPELGNWDITKGYVLEYINPNTWFAEIPFNESAGKAIAYKYVLIKGNQEIIREQRAFRRWILADDGIAKWEDVWEK